MWAIKNSPFTLPCPIHVSNPEEVLERWWLKDGSKLDTNIYKSATEKLLPSSLDSRERISLLPDGGLHFEKILHKVVNLTTSPPVGTGNHEDFLLSESQRNHSDEGNYQCFIKSAGGVVFSPKIHVFVAGEYVFFDDFIL